MQIIHYFVLILDRFFHLPVTVEDIIKNCINEIFLNNGKQKYWLITLGILVVGILILSIVAYLRKSSILQASAIAVEIAYVYLLFVMAVFSRTPDPSYGIILTPFSGYYTMRHENNYLMLVWIVINCIMMFPIGVILPFCFQQEISWKRALLVGFFLSYMVEFLQLFLQRGNFELFDDPISNVAGLMVGYWIGKIIYRSVKRIKGQ